MIYIWILIIAVVSIVWAFVSLKNEKKRHEIDHAKKEITRGRVIYHSSSAVDESESSL